MLQHKDHPHYGPTHFMALGYLRCLFPEVDLATVLHIDHERCRRVDGTPEHGHTFIFELHGVRVNVDIDFQRDPIHVFG